jgi:hypothetical protein
MNEPHDDQPPTPDGLRVSESETERLERDPSDAATGALKPGLPPYSPQNAPAIKRALQSFEATQSLEPTAIHFSDKPTFLPNQTLASRYRIVRFIGQGL